jgi:hypothetical protein
MLTSFISITIFFGWPFEYDKCGIFGLLSRIQKLHQSTWDHRLFNADRSSNFNKTTLKETNTMGG